MSRNWESCFVALKLNQKIFLSVGSLWHQGIFVGTPRFFNLSNPVFLYLDCEPFTGFQTAWLQFTVTSVFHLTTCFAALYRKRWLCFWWAAHVSRHSWRAALTHVVQEQLEQLGWSSGRWALPNHICVCYDYPWNTNKDRKMIIQSSLVERDFGGVFSLKLMSIIMCPVKKVHVGGAWTTSISHFAFSCFPPFLTGAYWQSTSTVKQVWLGGVGENSHV